MQYIALHSTSRYKFQGVHLKKKKKDNLVLHAFPKEINAYIQQHIQ